MIMISPTAKRVEQHTAVHVNQTIQRQTQESICHYAAHPERISERLQELDREWDIERTVEAISAGFSLSGLTLAAFLHRRWLILPIVVQGFMLMHALQGWCPPIPALRRMGFRTQHEIERERYALKILRGDFDDVLAVKSTGRHRQYAAIETLEAARRQS